MRWIGIGVLMLLWAFWASAFVQIVSLGLHFEHHLLPALLPGLPSLDITANEWLEYLLAVLLFWGTPLALGGLSWKMTKWLRR